MAKGQNGYETPFGVDFVVEQDLANQEGFKKTRLIRGAYYIDCPFCGGHKKLNVNVEKDVWRCAKCNESGNAITLHSKLTGVDTKKAYKDLVNRFGGLPAEYRSKISVKKETKYPDPAPLFIRKVAYEEMIKTLDLSEAHMHSLEKRGLSKEWIEKLGYRSYPSVGLSSLALQIIRDTGISKALENLNHNSNTFMQIPGFYDFGDDVKLVKRRSSILIPIVHISGEISGFQIRYDDLPENASQEQRDSFKRYSWLSSSEKQSGASCSGIENIHFVGFDFDKMNDSNFNTPESVCITEGALKADICHALSGKPFIGVLGVNNQSQLPKILEMLQFRGTKNINICFDMDYRDKPEVAQALDSLKEKIKEAKLDYKMITWDPTYKGLDDLLLEKTKRKAN